MDDPIFDPWSELEREAAARSPSSPKWRSPSSSRPSLPAALQARRPPTAGPESGAPESGAPASGRDPPDGGIADVQAQLEGAVRTHLEVVARRLAAARHEAEVRGPGPEEGASVALHVRRHETVPAPDAPASGSLVFAADSAESGVAVRTRISRGTEELFHEDRRVPSALDPSTIDELVLGFISKLLTVP